MKRTPLFLSFVIAFCFVYGCQQQGQEAVKKVVPRGDIAADAETIRKLSDEYGAAVTAGNVDGFLSLLTDDAILMPLNGKMIIGKETIRAWVQAGFETIKETGFEEITTPNEIKIFDGWAFDLGITSFRSKGKPLENTNKYIRIWQRPENGSWKLARVIWNPNDSSPSPPEQ